MRVKHDQLGWSWRMDPMAVIETAAGLTETRAGASGLDVVLRRRADIFDLCEQSHQAILAPREAGGLPHGLRAALAARMALANGDAALAAHYRNLIGGKDATLVAIAGREPTPPGAGAAVRAILRHVDLMTENVPAAARSDIEALTEAGLGDADIVRLQELIAFVSFQVRVVSGLRALGGAS
jgi:uncharacterized protein YciW